MPWFGNAAVTLGFKNDPKISAHHEALKGFDCTKAQLHT